MPVAGARAGPPHYGLHNLANVHRALGDLDGALQYLQRAISDVSHGICSPSSDRFI